MEKHIKERLVGAIVLVAIVVIVVPELLTGPREEHVAAPPPEPTSPVRTVTIDLESGAQRDATAADRIGEALPAPAATVNPEVAGAPAGSEGAVDPNGPATRDAREADPAAATSAGSGDPAERPAADGVAPSPAPVKPTTGADAAPPAPASTKPVGSSPPGQSSASATTSPKATAATAPKTPSAATTPTPKPSTPTPAAPKPAPAASPPVTTAPPRPAAPSASAAEGWVVQLGSFASRPNAERLATELRGKGYAGFVSEFRGSGRVLYRVRVGPEQDRARADAIAQRLARDGRKGTVVPHP